MRNKKKAPGSPSPNPQGLKIGSRVRCTDDHVEGRIVWANAVSVKIRWDDGEQVTWRRDSLADRPIEILAAAGDQDQKATPAASEQTVSESPSEHDTAASTSAELLSEPPPAEATAIPEAVAREQPPTTDTQAEETPSSQPSQEAPTPSEPTVEQPEMPSAATKQTRKRKPKKATDGGKEKKLSALDAAVKVLGETGQAMTCPELISAMATKGYWTSPGGKTPQATLYAAVAREITIKGALSRFRKADRGKFALTAQE
jgi:hypothetical protein